MARATATVKYLDHFTFKNKTSIWINNLAISILQIDELKANSKPRYNLAISNSSKYKYNRSCTFFSNKEFPGSKVKCFQFDLLIFNLKYERFTLHLSF